jgi:predicted GH43/DUF377 family glycosyl hydrolase
MKDATTIFTRHPANPILDPKDFPGIAKIFNPSPAIYEDKTILLVSIVPHSIGWGTGETRVASSIDGVNFTIEDKPFIELDTTIAPYDLANKHRIDNRITKIDDTYYILTPVAVDGHLGPCTILGKTKDFKTYEPIDIITLPPNRGASLFPEKIDGLYYKLDRPGGGTGNLGTIWLSSSPDLINWGRYRPVIRPYNHLNGTKMGPTPPIKTAQGWLVITHNVLTPCDGPHYSIGAIMLDLKNPAKVIGKTASWLLYPEKDYETRGTCDNVVFPCGALIDEAKDEIRLYYGAADTRVGLATGSLSATIEACLKEL